MIRPLYKEIYIIIALIAFGIYLVFIYDMFFIFNSTLTKKKIWRIFYEIIFNIINLYVTYIFTYKMASGYVPIYFILFMGIGVYLYFKWLRHYNLKLTNSLIIIYNKINPFINKFLKELLISKEVYFILLLLLNFTIKLIKHKKTIDIVANN